MSRRIGRFTLDLGFVERAIDNVDSHEAAELHAVLSKAIPISADYEPWNRRVVYVALSREFEEVHPGIEAPTYDVSITKQEGYAGHMPVETYEAKFARRTT